VVDADQKFLSAILALASATVVRNGRGMPGMWTRAGCRLVVRQARL